MAAQSESYSGYAIIELMDHRQVAGKVSEIEMFGTRFLALDVPTKVTPAEGDDDETLDTYRQFYSPRSIYCITPCSEGRVKEMVRYNPKENPMLDPVRPALPKEGLPYGDYSVETSWIEADKHEASDEDDDDDPDT